MTSILKVSEIQDPTNSNSALTIDSSGLIVMPQRPHFLVHKNATQTGSSGTVVTWQNILRNNGSHWDGTNHRFTAPVNGVYMLTLNWLSVNGSGVEDCSIYVNGVGIQHSRTPNRSGVASSNHITNNIAISYYLTASQLVDVRLGAFSSGSFGIYGDTNYWTTFSGVLIG